MQNEEENLKIVSKDILKCFFFLVCTDQKSQMQKREKIKKNQIKYDKKRRL
jgi:hypothetical protein